jgi:hypothetical protein
MRASSRARTSLGVATATESAANPARRMKDLRLTSSAFARAVTRAHARDARFCGADARTGALTSVVACVMASMTRARGCVRGIPWGL